jgi:uncharacterized protein (DUF885 family)
LEEVLKRYVSFCCETDPNYAHSIGQDSMFSNCLRFDGRITATQELSFLSYFNFEIAVINKTDLSSDQAVDLQLLRADLEHKKVQLADIAIYKQDPCMYVPLEEFGSNLFQLDKAKWHRMRQKLLCLPNVFEQGKLNLTECPEIFVSKAQKNCSALKRFLESTLQQLALKHGMDLSVEISEASAALESFENFLKDCQRSSVRYVGLGSKSYQRLIQVYLHSESTVDELIALGEQRFKEISKELEIVAIEVDPSKSWKEIARDIKLEHPPAHLLLKSYMAEIDSARDFFAKCPMIPMYPKDDGITGFDTPDFLRDFSPFGDFLNPKPFSQEHQGFLMLHPIRTDNVDAAQVEEALKAHDYAWIAVIAAHESYPGHHLQFLSLQSEHLRLFRKAYMSPVFYEGWGLYCEQLGYESGFFKREDIKFEAKARLTQLRLQLWRAARIILDAKLNCGLMTFQECVDFLVEHVMFHPDNAVGEVGIYLYRPCYAPSYMVGYIQLMELRSQYLKEHADLPLELALKNFHSWLFSHGTVPFKFLRKQ